MSARDQILARIRRAQKPAADDRIGDWAAHLAAPSQTAPVPSQATRAGEARISQFVEKATAADATVGRIDRLSDLPRALAEELRRRNLPAAVRTGTDPAFDLDWGAVERSQGPGRIEEPVTMSRAELAMAETGTLVLASGPANPVTLTFLGETHFVLVREADLMAGFEDMWAEWRRRGLDPRTVNLVTGPSRSADIGQTLQLGAHGPIALHVFLCAEG